MVKYTFEHTQNCPFCASKNLNIMGKRINGSQGLSPHKKLGICVSVVKCGNCDLIFANPMPVPESLSDHYGVPPEQYWKPEYFNLPEGQLSGLINWMNQIKEVKPGAKILDIGAGLGKAMLAFEKHGYNVYGIEPSEPFYQRAIEKMGVKKEKLILSSIEETHFEPNTFDVILFTAVLEHLYTPSEILLKVMGWLKPDGLLFIEVPSSNWLTSKLVNFVYKIRGLDYVTNLSPMHEPYHLFEFSKKTFEKHATANNYEVAAYRYYVCETFLPRFLNPFVKPIMKHSNSGMELAIWLRKKENKSE